MQIHILNVSVTQYGMENKNTRTLITSTLFFKNVSPCVKIQRQNLEPSLEVA